MNTAWTLTHSFSHFVARAAQSIHAWLRPQPAPASAPRPIVLAEPMVQTQRVRPLRVVRVMEANQTRSQTGRLVISGRLADVCAELDRLAACESA
jgi:hypothetical protein